MSTRKTLPEEVEEFVDNAKKIIGDPDISHVQNDISYYFNLTQNDLSEMDKEDCISAQYFILQFSISLTKKLNGYKARLLANKKEFSRSFSEVYSQYDKFSGNGVIVGKACGEYPHLKSMDDEITKLESLIQEYEDISFKTEKIAQVFKDLSFCK